MKKTDITSEIARRFLPIEYKEGIRRVWCADEVIEEHLKKMDLLHERRKRALRQS